MKKKYRFHLLGLAHLPASKEYMSCAFTQKNRKLTMMLLSLGHEVFFYGSEGSDVVEYCGDSPRLHFIETHTLADIAKDYGDGDNRFEIGYDWKAGDFRHDINKDEKKPSTIKFYAACSSYIREHGKPDDFILLTQGTWHKPIADAVGFGILCEPGIGYRGSKPLWPRAFESNYIMHFTYGSEHPFESMNGSYYDRVIPNYFDINDVKFSDKKGDYYLFIGRMIKRKGVLTAIKTCEALGKKLIMVGQGAVVDADGSIHDTEPTEWSYPASTWEYQGYADVNKRKELMAHAIATFVPTEYLECFAGVQIESMLSGTPVITTDFGVYPDTVRNGVNGFRCHTLDDFVVAAKEAKKLNPFTIALEAGRYLMQNVKWDYQRWFDDLYAVYESAKDEEAQIPTNQRRKGWHRVRKQAPEWRKQIFW